MDQHLMSFQGELPEPLHHVLGWDFIPWDLVRKRHGDHPLTPLIALLQAYVRLESLLDLEALVEISIPSVGARCLRCGTCCTYMRPGAVSGKTYRKWREKDVPVSHFYRAVERRAPFSTYNCWFHNDVRLRMCPFLLRNRIDSKPFCCIHHMGRAFRPGACSSFPPNPPTCQTGHFVPVP